MTWEKQSWSRPIEWSTFLAGETEIFQPHSHVSTSAACVSQLMPIHLMG